MPTPIIEKLETETATAAKPSNPLVAKIWNNVVINTMCIPVITKTGYKAAINPIPINPAIPSNENNAATTYSPINAPAGPNTHNAIGNIAARVNAGENTERIDPGMIRSKK